MNTKPVVLCILDGVGISPQKKHNAVAMAKMPFFRKMERNWPTTTLRASGTAVGLPAGTMGNSEVGHITIGSGRIVNQFLQRFQIQDWDKNRPLTEFIRDMKKRGGVVHLMGLMSDGKIHADVNEIIVIARCLLDAKLKICIHFFADGRDAPPRSAEKYIKKIKRALHGNNSWQFATLSGRYYAMDRNQNLDRTQLAFDAIVKSKSDLSANTIEDAVRAAYARGESDEFIRPTIIEKCPITKKDGILFCNYRSDRARQILRILTRTGARMLAFSQYGEDLDDKIPALIPDVAVKNTLGDILAAAGLKQLRIAETEKYNHVTYFFDAERTIDFPHEEKILVPSPRVATFDLRPEMSAKKITDSLIPRLKTNDVVILNYANGDMVGHTGNESAAICSMEFLDTQLARLVPAVLKLGGTILITADHGNAEKMWNDKLKSPWTAHTTNKVPLIIAGLKNIKLKTGCLSDIAPTMLKILGIRQPKEMTGKSLI